MTQVLKQAPYGVASFEKLRKYDLAYVDKTSCIQILEECGSFYPFAVRPRRFGKSVFANMLAAYYDIAQKEDFAKNFADTWVGMHPTPLASKYRVLMFDFSGIDAGDELIPGFISCVRSGLINFQTRYFQNDPEFAQLLACSYSSPAKLLTDFLGIMQRYPEKIYLIIDEYDQFAQNILSSDPEKFRSMTGNEGFLKNFYAVIKKFTNSVIDRTFITGVTSISLDSMTSGFNIASNLSMSSDFAAMFGFTGTELRKLIPQIIDVERYGHSIDEIFDRMKVLYDGYRFSPKSDISVFNSSMCLYYLREIAKTNDEPDELLDPAFSPDLSKLSGLLSLSQDRSFVEKIVLDVIFDRPIKTTTISNSINLNASRRLSNRDVLTALLFMGYLTFSPDSSTQLVCPNQAVKDQFFQYWFWSVCNFEDLDFPEDNRKIAINALLHGDVRPLLESVSESLTTSVGLHGLTHLNEAAIQMAVNMAVNTNSVYKVTAEEEALGAGFTDLVLRPLPRYRDAAAWVLEFKYLKKSDVTQEDIDAKIGEAQAQLERYALAENIASIANLKRAAIVFSGTELKAVKVF